MADQKAGTVLLSDGTVLPITNYFDEWGEDCEPEDAVTCVAGTDAFGWLSIDLTEFDWPTVH